MIVIHVIVYINIVKTNIKMFKGENMEEYKKALISVKNSLIIMNNKEKEKLKRIFLKELLIFMQHLTIQ